MKGTGSVTAICAMIGATVILLGSGSAVIAGPEIFFPLAENPVLAPQPNQWDGSGVLHPKAIGARDLIYLFYTGFSSTQPHSIGFARGYEPAGTLTRTFCNPVLTGDGTGFDSKSVSFPAVTLNGRTWTMFYLGQSGDGSAEGIGRATAAFRPCDYDHMCQWSQDDDPVLTRGGPGEWDSGVIMPGTVIVSDKGWRMYYSGGRNFGGGTEFMIGLALSPDGIVWSKYDDPTTTKPPFAESDPVFIPGSPGEWDSGLVFLPDVSRSEQGWEMYFTGRGSLFAAKRGIGYAYSPDGVHWARYAGNPVGKMIEKPSVLTFWMRLMYYDYGSFGAGIGLAVPDTDSDGLLDNADNCTMVANVGQLDSDGDRYGNACDPDLNNDCRVDYADLQLIKLAFSGTDPNSDFNGDGVVDFADLEIMKTYFARGPGPSGTGRYCAPGWGCAGNGNTEGPIR